MTPEQVREAYLQKCLEDIKAYCNEHKHDCVGCIFYRQITVFDVTLPICRVAQIDDTWGK